MKVLNPKPCLAWALAALCGMVACTRESISPDADRLPVRTLSARESQTVTTTNDFAFRLFRQLDQQEAERNTLISPFSVATALIMVYNGAGTTTKAQIQNTLGLAEATDAQINESYRSLYQLLNGIDKTVTFTSANAVWYRNTLQPQPAFVQNTQKYFGAQVQGLDFANPDALNTMNAWVNGQTGGKIPQIVSEVRPDHVMFLMNAIYFKGTWAYQFDKKLTTDGTFWLRGGTTVQHPFMELSGGRYLLHQDSTHTLVDLPYGNKQFSMTLVMPAPTRDAGALADGISADRLNGWLAAADTSSLPLFLPKFRVEYEKKLNETLGALGMPEAFGYAGRADFSGLFGGGTAPLYIDEVKHKAYVEVDEAGTEAAAVTSVSVGALSAQPPSVRFNRPFVFLIREKATGVILLMGKLLQPEL